MLRIGRQPYGVLPATALSDWRADRDRDVDALLAPWLRRARRRWREVVEEVPRIRPDQPADQITVDALSRLPVATGLAMRRMNGPDFAVPLTPREDPPSTTGIPGVPPDAALRWTTRSDGWTDLGWGLDPATGTPLFVTRFTEQAATFGAKAVATADYLRDVRAFLAGTLPAADFDHNWPVELSSGRETPPRRSTFFDLEDDTDVLSALVFIPNWAFMTGDEAGEDGSDDPVRRAFAVTSDVDQLVADVLDDVRDSERPAKIAAAARSAATMVTLEGALRAVAAVPPARLPELLLEVVDVYSHRLDAWVTSLATRRLAAMRRDVDGARVGGYGWVEDLRPPVPREEVDLGGEEGTAVVSEQDGYMHAPSLQHAAAAAVLRSGFLSQPGDETFAVNLNSRRARIARWLLAGVRQGQSLGSLLGYRFERALHDADLDEEIDDYRRNYPAPTVPQPGANTDADTDLWSRSTLAIAARNVVDGMALANDPDALSAADRGGRSRSSRTSWTRSTPSATSCWPRACTSSSAATRCAPGSPPTRSAAAATCRTPSTRCAPRTGPARSPTGSPRCCQRRGGPDRLGDRRARPPASRRSRAGSPTCSAPPRAGRSPARPGRRASRSRSPRTGSGRAHSRRSSTRRAPSNPGFAPPSPPRSAPSPARRSSSVDQAGPACTAWRSGSARCSPPPSRCCPRTCRPPSPRGPSTSPTPAAGSPPSPPTPPSPAGRVRPSSPRWPPLPTRWAGPRAGSPASAPRSPRYSARRCRCSPGSADRPRPRARTPAPRLSASGSNGSPPSGRQPARCTKPLSWPASVPDAARRLRATQDPTAAADAWVGGTFDAGHRPSASTHLVWHAPRDLPAAGPVAGLLLDEWAELLPGADRIRESTDVSPAATSPAESELTGLAFHYDRPDAKAPHTVLVAVPPDLERGWTSDGLVQVLRETLELAKLRAVDLMDLTLTGELLPGIRISPDGATGRVLARWRPDGRTPTRPGPFRFEPGTGRPK